jgi:hypothetical protein
MNSEVQYMFIVLEEANNDWYTWSCLAFVLMHIACVSDVVNYMHIHFKVNIIISIVQAKNVGVANQILIRVILPLCLQAILTVW